MKRNIKQIIIHCSATPNGRAFKAKDINEWHRQRFNALVESRQEANQPI